jgi:WD40 repeat protein
LVFPTTLAAVHFTPDGTSLFIGTDTEVQLYDTATGKTTGPAIPVPSLWDASVSPDGRSIATASGEGFAQLWDAVTRTSTSDPLAHRGPVTQVAFSPDSQRLISLSADRTARIWNTADGKPVGEPLGHLERPFRARFSPEGGRVTTVDFGHTVRLWDATSGELLSPPWRHAWEPDAVPTHTGALIAVEGRLTHWDASRSTHHGEIRVAHDESLKRIDTAAHGSLLVASSPRGAWLLNAATGLTKAGPLMLGSDTTSVAIAPDDEWVAVGCEDGAVRLWTAAGDRHDHGEMNHAGAITHVRFSPTAAQLLTCSADHTARIWNVRTGAPMTPPLQHEGALTDGDFSPDGTMVVTASEDGKARLWSSATWQPIGNPQVLRPGEPDQAVTRVCFSPRGDAVLLAGHRGDLLVWPIRDTAGPARALHMGSGISSAEFSSDGRRVLACGYTNVARVWDLRSPESPPVLLPVGTAAIHGQFHPNSVVVAISGFDGVRLWDCTTGRPLGDRLGPVAKSMAFTADGRWLIAADQVLRWSRTIPDDRPADALIELVRLIAMRAIDDRGSLQFLSSERIQELFDTLSARWPEEFVSDPGRELELGETDSPK